MLTFPCAKINLGLNIIGKRSDGYHDLETVFYPIPLTDALEICPMDPLFPSEKPCDLKVTGNAIDCDEQNNLVIKAYELLAANYKLPRLHTHLVKRIPSQAGLGGGSADAAYMIRIIDEHCQLNLGNDAMERYAAQLGSDCAFFITARAAFATGRGEVLEPAKDVENILKGHYIAIVKPDIAVSTREAFANIACRKPEKSCREIVRQPIATWRNALVNDFETTVFTAHPELSVIKEKLYTAGAVYAQMSGSGSVLYGIFDRQPPQLAPIFPDCFTFSAQL